LLPPGLSASGPDAKLGVYSGFMVLILGCWTALAPALQAMRLGSLRSLHSGMHQLPMSSRFRTLLIVGQVALSFVLVVGAGLLVRSLLNVKAVDLGLHPSGLVSIQLDTRGTSLSPPAVLDLYQKTMARLEVLPGYESGALSVGSPFTGGWAASVSVPGRDVRSILAGKQLYFSAVSSRYFETIGATLTIGRGFLDRDRLGTQQVAVVNKSLASALWPGENPIGKCFAAGDDPVCTTVVGVVGDIVTFQVLEERPLEFYLPLSQNEFGLSVSALLVRFRDQSTAVVPMIRREIASLHLNLPSVDVRPITDYLAPQMKPWQLGTAMFAAYGGLAVILTSIGLFGLIAYSVTRRTREFGLRMALGASHSQLRALVVVTGVKLVALGALIGLLVVLALERVWEPLLYHVHSWDPTVISLALAILALVVPIAAYAPARRATRVDPVKALKTE